jgi:rhodanese-related sulfurtransferase
MKRRATIISIVLALTLVFGSFQVFAHEGGTAEKGDERAIESAAMNLYNDTVAGKYQLVGTDDLYASVTAGEDMVIVDTMPDWSWKAQHIPGAINVECGDNGPNGTFTEDQQKALVDQVKAAANVKTVKKYYNKKTKKWQTKKIKGAKTKTEIKSNKKIVVYCGFVKCRRSHEAAQYLVKQGFKNVYRYPGGIYAWLDAGYAPEAAPETPAA